MNMLQYTHSCKKRARQIAKIQPGLRYTKALDLAAQEQGFQHFTALNKLLKLLGEDGVPSQLAIVLAGGDSRLSPHLSISTTVRSGWSAADPVSG
ncbi:hypothetical protein [Aeromonas enteropelogenes]|uniref:hypothetical protein n=1 Tax=Aeromonas enteropelogenes TaxID=29489 RepID=UPI003BA2748B